MDYYELPIQLDGERHWLVYYQNDEDGVLVDENRNVLAFSSVEPLRAYARKKRIKPQEARKFIDFDALEVWLKKPMPTADCPTLYAAWNLLGDIATSLGEGVHYLGYERRYQYLQEELLWGCNLPGPWASDQPYIPEFSEREIGMLAEVLRGGVRLLRSRLQRVR